jgi:hypothetical protein|tara:strand:- start:145 stop:282 length:138 start_codon:yes stop_codon:yes gene_type:complete
MANNAISLAIQVMITIDVTNFVALLQIYETNRQERRTGFVVKPEI